MNKIAIGSDHAGFEFKNLIIKHLQSKGLTVLDKGPFNNESVDYPDFIHPVAQEVENNDTIKGIILCGSGNGAAITANKHKNIRCALVWKSELAVLARQHNDANIISIPARYITKEEALSIVDSFLTTDFEGGRHQNRINKITCF
ncbi:MAG: ribose 5-phosphate isomerase B [Solirubrobacteraceae bacterium]